MGITPESKPIQLESIDQDLLNSLWNGIKIHFLDEIAKYSQFSGDTEFEIFCKVLWINFYKEPIDNIPSSHYDAEEIIKKRFFKYYWHQVYDFIEFIATLDYDEIIFSNDNFIEFTNTVLEKENSAYRIIKGNVAPISNELEVGEIQEAIEKTKLLSSLNNVNVHLNAALVKLSDKENPDYRNSVKESISAVESIAKKLSENKKDSLSGALDKIKAKIQIHPSLEKGFKQIYGYTSDGDGIRHALKDDNNCTYDEAKFMLVTCSAFINFLVSKANKNGINLQE